MEDSTIIRTLAPHEWPTWRAIRLRALADSPDAFGSTLADEEARPAQAWAERLSAAAVSGQDYPLVAECDGAPAGLVWAKVDSADASVVNIFQMWVAPECRGRGVAAVLLRAAIAWAKSKKASAVHLGVTCGNSPAVQLYLREGFVNDGAPQPRRQGSPLREQAMRLALDQSAA